jgi:hypothetical protein
MFKLKIRNPDSVPLDPKPDRFVRWQVLGEARGFNSYGTLYRHVAKGELPSSSLAAA